MQPVTTRIPKKDVELLAEFEDELGADRAEVLRRLIRQGLTAWRKERALDALADGTVTIRQAAEMANVQYVEMLNLAADAGVDTGTTHIELHADLNRFDGRS